MMALHWTRASEWWEYKLVPALAAAYATCLYLGATPWDALPALAMLLVALIPGGIFVSVLNDLTDRADDLAAGKHNRQTGTPPHRAIAILGLTLACGAGFAWLWRDDIWLVATYASGWLAYAFYSLPPVRLKKRGLAGVACDAVGANLVPAMLATLLCARTLGTAPGTIWLAAIACWSLGFGLRGILWHQIGDMDRDRASGVRTLAVRIGEERCVRWARYVILPAELIAGAILAVLSGVAAAVLLSIALIAYWMLMRARIDRFEMAVTIVRHRPRTTILFHEYYDVLVPLALLIAAAFSEPLSLVVLAAHALIFPIRWRQLIADLIRLRDPKFKSRRAKELDGA